MTAFAVLLNGPVRHDGRVIRIVRALAAHGRVDLFYTDPADDDRSLFDDPVRLNPVAPPSHLGRKLLRHSFFHLEYGFLADAAAATGQRYDIVYANDLPTLDAGARLKRRHAARLVYDSHEIFIETLSQFFPANPSLPKRAVFRILLAVMRGAGRRAEARLLRKVDAFVTVNESLAAYFQRRYGARDIHVVMNAPVYHELPATPVVDFRERFGWAAADRVFLYQGTINRGRAFQVLLPAFAGAPVRARLVFVGDGSLRPELEAEVARLGVQDRVKFLGRVPPETLPGYTTAADAGIDLVDLNLSKELSASNKFFEYLHAGIPSLCSDTVEHRRVIERYKVGILVANTVEDVRRGIVELMESPEVPAMRAAGREAARVYNWQKQAAVLDGVVRGMTTSAVSTALSAESRDQST